MVLYYKKNKKIYTIILYLMLTIIFVAFLNNNIFAFASNNAVNTAFRLVLRAVRVIGSVAGALFVLVGVVRFVIAHANEDGPNQQKASLMIATGIALIIVVSLIQIADLTQMVDFTGGRGGGTNTNSFGANITPEPI